jgi:hypothetical protein
MSANGKGKRGFASMDPAKGRVVAGKGGKSAHAQGRAHEFTTEEPRAAGRKSGLVRLCHLCRNAFLYGHEFKQPLGGRCEA